MILGRLFPPVSLKSFTARRRKPCSGKVMYQVPRENCATHPGSGCIQTLKITGQHDTRSRYRDCETARCCPEFKARLTQDGRDFHDRIRLNSLHPRTGCNFSLRTRRDFYSIMILFSSARTAWPNMRNNLTCRHDPSRHVPVMKRWKNRKGVFKECF